MAEISSEDRRTDAIGTLQVKVAVLEAHHNDNVRARAIHEASLDSLSIQHATMDTQMAGLIEKFDEKFVTLGDKFDLGFKTARYTVIAAIFIGGVLWNYNKSLDEKFSPKLDKIVSSALEQQEANQSSINKMLSDISIIAKEKTALIEQVETIKDVSKDVKHLQSLKSNQNSK